MVEAVEFLKGLSNIDKQKLRRRAHQKYVNESYTEMTDVWIDIIIEVLEIKDKQNKGSEYNGQMDL